jgi:hypothetical protein
MGSLPDAEVSDKKFVERLRRQASDGHGWDKVPDMLREAANRIERLREFEWMYKDLCR